MNIRMQTRGEYIIYAGPRTSSEKTLKQELRLIEEDGDDFFREFWGEVLNETDRPIVDFSSPSLRVSL
jgi:hypothetical protein